MHTRPAVDIELLCAQTSWIRELARHLVRDPAGADDIAQETLLAALQAPPPDVADVHRLRAWLRRVAINLARLATRRSVRRQAREERVAQFDRQDSTADTVLRDSVHRCLSDAIGSLEEPYRSTLELRYFEGVSTSDIATRMGTTDNAVRKRLFRARNKLRESLDTVHQGDRCAWFSALLPLAGLPRASAEPAAAGLRTWLARWMQPAQHMPLTLGALGGLGVAAAVLLLMEQPQAKLRAPAPAARVATLGHGLVPAALDAPGGRALVSASPASAAGSAQDEPAAPPPPSEPAATAATAGAAPVTPAPRSLAVHGRVLDLSGAPVAGLALSADDRGEPLAWSGSDGRFALSVAIPDSSAAPQGPWPSLRVQDERWTTVRRAELAPDEALLEALVIVSRAVRVAGRVVDEAGAPLAGVALRLDAEEQAFLAIDARLSRTLLAEARTTSDALGRFTLEHVPSGTGLALEALVLGPAAERCERSTRVPVPSQDELDLEIEIALVRAPPVCVAGFVRFEDGSPAADTLVRLGERATRTDERGAFELRVRDVAPGAALTATLPGFRQVRLPELGSLLSQRHGSASPGAAALRVALVLVESQGTLSGRVLDAEGRPCAGWLVRADAEEEPGDAHAGGALAASAPTTLTDRAGRFELADLLEREHRLLAWDPRTLQATRSEPLATGLDVTLSLPREAALVATLVGRVTDHEGAPVEGALVRVALALAGSEESDHAFAGCSATDALGFFTLSDVPAGAEIAVRAAGVEVHQRFETNGDALVVRLPRARELCLRTALDADSFALLDAAGNELGLQGLTREPARRGRLFHGASIHYAVHVEEPPSAVVLYRAGEEIGRGPLQGALLAPWTDG